MYVNYYDSHVHTNNSPDGRDSVDYYCRCAIKKGVKGLAFTDHCDIDSGRHICMSIRDNLLAEVNEARELYGDELEIAMGLEIGEAHHNPALTEEVLDCGLDFVIGSIHMLRDEQDFYFIDYAHTDLDSLMGRYYEELYELAASDLYDVLGHINYQSRYMPPKIRDKFDFDKYSDELESILSIVVEKGRGIEINTSGIRRELGKLLPSKSVIAQYRRLGGRIITVGSDSHRAADVGCDIDAGLNMMREVGYDQFAFYRQRRAVMLDIE